MTPRRLTATEVSDLAQTLPMWQVVDEQLLREIQAPTYMIAINWVVAIAGAAESLDHHPDIDHAQHRVPNRARSRLGQTHRYCPEHPRLGKPA